MVPPTTLGIADAYARPDAFQALDGNDAARGHALHDPFGQDVVAIPAKP